ncbi:hypothetical protein ASD79_12310 [Caulobacter sp. Root655]|uniref:hypothetical protein n=1 Tax=Caulobacter sp. Root655 TaxID=1736578 RepID=UPI0006F2B9E2|nr:hypothetical protein [Caulobacter sp. Root655]KRA59450.1 hypothetical protein ASD79_12310 [Caulobacter sp. Root655]
MAMIAHFSIPARDPRGVAEVFGKIIDGMVMPFPVVEGAWVAIAHDGSGLGVEVVPETSAHHPGQGVSDGRVADGPTVMPWETQIRQDGDPQDASGYHVAITSSLSADQIIALGQAKGWRAVHCDRGGVFDLVELWIENRALVEVLPPEGAARYHAFYVPEVAGRMFAGPPPGQA